MSKKTSKKKGKSGKSGGFGKTVMVMTVLVVAGGAAFWFLAPDQARAQLTGLKLMLGL